MTVGQIEKLMNGQMDRLEDKHTDRRTDGYMDRLGARKGLARLGGVWQALARLGRGG